MSIQRPRILVSGRLNKLVEELRNKEVLKSFELEYIPDVQQAVSMLPQIGEAYCLVFLSSDSDNTDQLLTGLEAFINGPRSFLLISLSVSCPATRAELLKNPAVLSTVKKPLNASILSDLFQIFGNGGPWIRKFE